MPHNQLKTTTMSKSMKITKEDIMNMNRKVSRDIELENNLRINHHKVHTSKKSYNRQQGKKINWD